jgi:hypothetical protein
MKNYAVIFALLFACPAGAEFIEDPWSIVPAVPTTCYREQDNFATEVEAAIATLRESSTTQAALSKGISDQLGAAADVDPFALAQRMQEYMMTNPEEGMKMLQSMQTMGQSIGADISQENERRVELTTALDDLRSQYRNEYAAMRAPIDARLDAMLTKIEGHEAYYDEAATKLLPEYNRQASAAYEQLCGKWWQGRRFAAPLEEYRSFLVDEYTPRLDETSEQTRQQLDIQGIDTSEYRSTASMDAAIEYLEKLQQIYAERLEKPSNRHVVPGGFEG